MNNSDSLDGQETSSDSHCAARNKQSLRLRLVRAFSSGTPKTPRSSLSSNSGCSTPNSNSPCAKTRYSWQLTSPKEGRTQDSPENGVFLSQLRTRSCRNSLLSPIASQNPHSSTWCISER